MRHLEYFNHWYDGLLNSWPFCIDDAHIKSFGLAWGFIENGKWQFKPRITGNAYQYFNALFFVRMTWPLGLFLHIRWTNKVRYLPNWLPKYGGNQAWQFIQLGIGYKLSGRFSVHFRLQTDASAAVGYHAGMPNLGQATGFNYGGH